MNLRDKYPDLVIAKITTYSVYNDVQAERFVKNIVKDADTAVIYYIKDRHKITIYTSRLFKQKLDRLLEKKVFTDPTSLLPAEVISDKTEFVCGELCVTVQVGDRCDKYSCDYVLDGFKEVEDDYEN